MFLSQFFQVRRYTWKESTYFYRRACNVRICFKPEGVWMVSCWVEVVRPMMRASSSSSWSPAQEVTNNTWKSQAQMCHFKLRVVSDLVHSALVPIRPVLWPCLPPVNANTCHIINLITAIEWHMFWLIDASKRNISDPAEFHIPLHDFNTPSGREFYRY